MTKNSILANKNFKPTKLTNTSGFTSGGYKEWLIPEINTTNTNGEIFKLVGRK